MKTNKYLYLFVVQGYYNSGYGWEDVCQSEDRKEARANFIDYVKNERQYSHRMIKRRELNPQYTGITE